MLYLLFKWVHVLAAVVAFGANITYGIWITRASRDPHALPFTLRSIKLIDDRLANPAYAFLLITGLLMVFSGKLRLTAPWLLTSLVLYVFVTALGLLGYTPTLRRQISVLDSEGFESPNYRRVARRGTIMGAVLGALVTIIVFLMVVKPALWA
jgi:uncharacterized membrane protein